MYRFAWCMARLLPESVLRRVATLVAWCWARQSDERQRIYANNLRVTLPGISASELDRHVRTGLTAYLQDWVTTLVLPTLRPTQITERCTATGDAPIRTSLAAGQGVVVALAHSGSWDLAGAWSAVDLAPVATVAEDLDGGTLTDRFAQFRSDLGMRVYRLGQISTTRKLLGHLANGGLVALLADRVIGQSQRGTAVVEWGSAQLRVPLGPAALARVSNCSLVPAFVRHNDARGRGCVVEFGPVISAAQVKAVEPGSAMQMCVDFWVTQIRRYPDQWHVLQPLAIEGER